jgi:hypothetical protein
VHDLAFGRIERTEELHAPDGDIQDSTNDPLSVTQELDRGLTVHLDTRGSTTIVHPYKRRACSPSCKLFNAAVKFV